MNVQAAIDAGLFVQFVYDRCEGASPTVNLDGLFVLDRRGEPVVAGKSYRVLKTVYCNDLATDLSSTGPLRKFVTIGIIAQNAADAADVVIAIRGTEGVWEWIQDVKFLPRSFPAVHGSGLTDDGFTDMYMSFSLKPAPASGLIEDIRGLLPTNAMITVAGHSLGAALATLMALDLAANTNLPVGVYTLASPRVGDLSFHNLFNHIVPNAYRVANRLDIVTKLPPALLYFHVGDETELRPGTELKFSLPCEHHLTSYLHMLGALLMPGGQANPFPLDADCTKVAAALVAVDAGGEDAVDQSLPEVDV